jgi:hypothetical protein
VKEGPRPEDWGEMWLQACPLAGVWCLEAVVHGGILWEARVLALGPWLYPVGDCSWVNYSVLGWQ